MIQIRFTKNNDVILNIKNFPDLAGILVPSRFYPGIEIQILIAGSTGLGVFYTRCFLHQKKIGVFYTSVFYTIFRSFSLFCRKKQVFSGVEYTWCRKHLVQNTPLFSVFYIRCLLHQIFLHHFPTILIMFFTSVFRNFLFIIPSKP